MRPPLPVSCIILSAGDSGRMGTHKALLPFGREKITFLEQIIKTYHQAGVDEMVVVVNSSLLMLMNELNPDLPGNVQIVENLHPEKGRFYSLQTGLKHVSTGSFVFIQNIDNPFIDKETALKMLENMNRAMIVLPAFSGKTGHPLLVHPKVCEKIIMSESSEARLDHFIQDFSAAKIEVAHGHILANINTPEDYERWFNLRIPSK
ncbi:MAG: NTP transferase domain-containing protein [Lentimicrobium sp.]|nr:NTP transferase domain-containing protein [Lentimicrobium sp.]